MRFLFLSISAMILLNATTVSAQGLPANPWSAKQEVIGDTVLHISRDDINPPIADNNINNQEESLNFNTQELKDTALRIKEKLQQDSNQTNNDSASKDEEVSAVEAFNAFNTLSKYVGQNNQSDNSKVQNNTSSASFDEIKRKVQEMMKKNNTNSASYSNETSQNNALTQELNKAKSKYHHYKSKVTSNYNDLKSKAQPVINSVKKGINEAEKATGMNF